MPSLNEGPDAIDVGALGRHELGETLYEKIRARYDVKEQILGAQAMRYHERIVMLSVLDGLWKDHLLAMDHLKEGIGLRGYAQQDPLVAYKKESFDMFESMMLRFQEDTSRHLFRMQIIGPDGQPIETPEQLAASQQRPQPALVEASQPVLVGAGPGGQSARQSSGQSAEGASRPAPAPVVPTRAPSTTIDALEREFQKKKERELERARQSGGRQGRGRRPPPRRRKGRPQRQVSVRLRQEVQELPRGRSLAQRLL